MGFSGISAADKHGRSDGDFDELYYQRYYGSRTSDWYAWLLSEIIQFGKPGSILDVGCGLGLLVELANQWGLRAKGIDSSEAAVRLALERTPCLDLQHGDLRRPLPFADQSFDNIIMHQVIPSFTSNILISALEQCHRVLSRAGILFIYSASKRNLSAYKRDPSQRYRLHPSELRALLEGVGFSVLQEPNSSRFLARNRALGTLAGQLMRTGLKDWASATANAYARRP
jgi:SAM-dependent methyltransferase